MTWLELIQVGFWLHLVYHNCSTFGLFHVISFASLNKIAGVTRYCQTGKEIIAAEAPL